MNSSNPRGPGFWKRNSLLLPDVEYVDLIRKTINEVAKEYQNNNQVDAILLRDTMKLKIRSRLICYARPKKSIIEREILGGKNIPTAVKIR